MKKTLSREPIFMWSWIAPLVIALCVVILECFPEGKVFIRWFSKHLNVPITIMAISIPLMAVAASLHRSRQSLIQIEHQGEQIFNQQVQIEEQNKQNNFNNYFVHREIFKIYMNDILAHGKFGLIGITINYAIVYKVLFNKSSVNSVQIAITEGATDNYVESFNRFNERFLKEIETQADKDVLIVALLGFLGGLGINVDAPDDNEYLTIGKLYVLAIVVIREGLSFGVTDSDSQNVMEKEYKKICLCNKDVMEHWMIRQNLEGSA